MPAKSTEAAIATRSAYGEEKKLTPSGNSKRFPFERDNSGSKAAANKRRNQTLASQRHRNQIKQNKSLMADVDAYSSEVDKLSDLVLQQRAQLLILNEFKELVLAKETELALAVLDGRPQVVSTYVTSSEFC